MTGGRPTTVPRTSPPTTPRSRAATPASGCGCASASTAPCSWPASRRRPRRPTAGRAAGDQLIAVDGTSTEGETVVRGRPPAARRAGRRRPTHARPRRLAVTRDVSIARVAVTSDDVTVERLSGRRPARSRSRRSPAGSVGRSARPSPPTPAASGDRAGVVLDLRSNPGGLVDEAVEVAGAFLDGGVVVSYDRRGRGTRTLDAASGGDVATPLVVLVDGGTASAAEIVDGGAAGPWSGRGRREPYVRQGVGAGAGHALRRVGHRADRRPVRHAGRPHDRRRRHRARPHGRRQRPGGCRARVRSTCSPGSSPRCPTAGRG